MLVIGIDEVGRGSCIGPVTAAAVALDGNLSVSQKKSLRDLDDSKQLSAQQRSDLCAAIQAHCLWGVGEATKEEVERHNVYYAALLAGYRAYTKLLDKLDPERQENVLIVLDGKAVIPDLPKEKQRAVIKADGKSFSVAAASVVAKHVRDSYIIKLAKDYPGYGWETNMGYGTPCHRRALETLGPTPHHRGHFKAVQDAQLSLLS